METAVVQFIVLRSMRRYDSDADGKLTVADAAITSLELRADKCEEDCAAKLRRGIVTRCSTNIRPILARFLGNDRLNRPP